MRGGDITSGEPRPKGPGNDEDDGGMREPCSSDHGSRGECAEVADCPFGSTDALAEDIAWLEAIANGVASGRSRSSNMPGAGWADDGLLPCLPRISRYSEDERSSLFHCKGAFAGLDADRLRTSDGWVGPECTRLGSKSRAEAIRGLGADPGPVGPCGIAKGGAGGPLPLPDCWGWW